MNGQMRVPFLSSPALYLCHSRLFRLHLFVSPDIGFEGPGTNFLLPSSISVLHLSFRISPWITHVHCSGY